MYRDHYEHLKDVMKLYNLKDEAEIDLYVKQILKHENESNIFLPIIYLRNVYFYEDIEVNNFYLFLAFSLSSSTDYPVYVKQFINSLANELIDNKGLLKQRYIDFLFNPYKIISKPWITYFGNFNFTIIETKEMVSLLQLFKNFFEDKSDQSFIIWLIGMEGVGRKTHILYAAKKMEFNILFVDIKQIFFDENFENYLQEVITECKLINVIPCFCNMDSLFDLEYNYKLKLLLFKVKQSFKIIFFISENNNYNFMFDDFTTAQLKIPMPNFLLLNDIWNLYLSQYLLDNEPDFNNLTYKLTPLQIRSFVNEAKNLAIINNSETLKISDIYSICQRYNVNKGCSLGEPVSLLFTWSDLIVHEHVKLLMQSVINRIRYRNIVYNEWGFSDKLPYGKGVSVLFEGSPGTGKTMAAQVLAKELNIPMYKIDVSTIVSKYIGETEKNIKAIFD